MAQNPEKRNTVRLSNCIPIRVKDLKAGRIFNAKMLNSSKNGFYFETDNVLSPGTEIYIGMQKSSSPYSSEIYELHRAIIIRCKKLVASFSNYGYGAIFIIPFQKSNIKENGLKDSKELRKYQRKAYFKPVLFCTQDGVFEGLTKNVSASGVYLEAKENFEVGQIITLALPLKNEKKFKIKGEVVWSNGRGFGIRFLGKVKNQRASKLQK
jgi:Tfp pilus assembly protein PilZ